MKKLSLFIFIALIVYCTQDSNTSGIIEDTDTGIVVFLADGITPAQDALVKFIPANYSQDIGLTKTGKATKFWSVKTDENGRFNIPSMPDSIYNVVIEKDTLKALQKEIYVSSEANLLQSDTLELTGSVCAFVSLQPNDMDKIQSVYVQVLGTDVEFRNVDADGKFCFENLAAGRYRLRLETNLTDYTQTFRENLCTKWCRFRIN